MAPPTVGALLDARATQQRMDCDPVLMSAFADRLDRSA